MSEQHERSVLVALSQAQIEALIELIEGEQEIRIKASTNKGSKLPVEVLGKAWNQLRIALYALQQQKEVPPA